MDPIKEAFAKAKQDIFSLQSQIKSLRQEISSLKNTIQTSSLNISNQQTNNQSNTPNIPTDNPADHPKYQSNDLQIPAYQDIQTNRMPLNRLKTPFSSISIGNGGVPTDKQTNQQTDRHTGNKGVQITEYSSIDSVNSQKNEKIDKISRLEQVSNILNSLDTIKKELRTQFKHLTAQEMAIFSCIYSLEEQGFVVDYPLVSQKMSLSESSIRDYTQKIIKKGIPIIKTKENNKKILLSIDQNLKKIASLQTISTLRQL